VGTNRVEEDHLVKKATIPENRSCFEDAETTWAETSPKIKKEVACIGGMVGNIWGQGREKLLAGVLS